MCRKKKNLNRESKVITVSPRDREIDRNVAYVAANDIQITEQVSTKIIVEEKSYDDVIAEMAEKVLVSLLIWQCPIRALRVNLFCLTGFKLERWISATTVC